MPVTTETKTTKELLREVRDKFCREVRKNTDKQYIAGYIDGVLDMYNTFIKETNEP